MAEFVTPANVKDYLQATGVTGQWAPALIGSNIAAASENLQRWTHRQFEPQGSNVAVTKTFTTHGAAFMTIPDLRAGTTTVTLQSTALTADTTFWLVPDKMNSGVFTGIQFRPFNRYDYRGNPDWFDRNLDSPRYLGRVGTMPNDLSITSNAWGHSPYPAPLQHATVVLAGYYTLRSDALLGGAVNRLEQGVIFDLSQLPREVADFVETWKISDSVAVA